MCDTYNPYIIHRYTFNIKNEIPCKLLNVQTFNVNKRLITMKTLYRQTLNKPSQYYCLCYSI